MAQLIPPLEHLAQSNVILDGPGENWQGLAKELVVVVITQSSDTTPGRYLIGPNGEGKLKTEITAPDGHRYIATSVKPDFERQTLDVRLVRQGILMKVLTPFGTRMDQPEDFTFYHTREGLGDFRGIYTNCTAHVIPSVLYNERVAELFHKK